MSIKLKRYSRKGLTLVEGALGLVVLIAVYAAATAAWTEVQYRLSKSALSRQVAEISSGASSWRGQRSNYSGVSMTVLCAAGQQSVGATTCGGVGGSGTNSNAYGGNFVLQPHTNVSQLSLQITGLPASKITNLADGLAQITANQCASSVGCSTITVSGTSITLVL
ncbi:hypothetical protein NTH44_003106 [Vibrio metoecus]|nr:hypothetical protein [Vibrio cholerae]